MDEPLLGSLKRPSSLIIHNLSRIPESNETTDHIGIPRTPSSIKEKLIFGSPDLSPTSSVAHRQDSLLADDICYEAADAQVPYNDNTCVCGRSFNESGRETQANEFDDSFIDSRIIAPQRSQRRSWNDLTKVDLNVRSPSPSFRGLATSPMAAWLLSEKDAAIKQSDRDVENGAYTVNMPSEPAASKTDADDTSHRRKLHRAKTAPALTPQVAEKPVKSDTGIRLPSLPAMSVVSQACIGLLLYLTVGVIIYSLKGDEFSVSSTSTHYIIDAFYFCIVTMCTIGYGDITPITPATKLFACAFVLVGFGFIDILLSGMVNYVLDTQETVLLSALTAGHHETAKNYLVDVKKGRMRIRLKVSLAFGVVIMCLGLGTFVMHYVESLAWLDAFYLSCMSVTTVGYGDHAFKTMAGRAFASVWLLVSTLAVARSFIYLAEARIDKRHRLIAKLALEREMTMSDLVAADIDNDGCIRYPRDIFFEAHGSILQMYDKSLSENSWRISSVCLHVCMCE
ncbi:hypothetical protein KP509_11G079800 [Ceratopteris richardii]|uniref:Potassium channel domain-containing protein n=1 Tax=Ceratopteris richardii TaxID=49495 RepID=A0A8T2TU88_CERRI|nr:hypothetical protein KP509_11G079800 [Ceratopteris richardii]